MTPAAAKLASTTTELMQRGEPLSLNRIGAIESKETSMDDVDRSAPSYAPSTDYAITNHNLDLLSVGSSGITYSHTNNPMQYCNDPTCRCFSSQESLQDSDMGTASYGTHPPSYQSFVQDYQNSPGGSYENMIFNRYGQSSSTYYQASESFELYNRQIESTSKENKNGSTLNQPNKLALKTTSPYQMHNQLNSTKSKDLSLSSLATNASSQASTTITSTTATTTQFDTTNSSVEKHEKRHSIGVNTGNQTTHAALLPPTAVGTCAFGACKLPTTTTDAVTTNTEVAQIRPSSNAIDLDKSRFYSSSLQKPDEHLQQAEVASLRAENQTTQYKSQSNNIAMHHRDDRFASSGPSHLNANNVGEYIPNATVEQQQTHNYLNVNSNRNSDNNGVQINDSVNNYVSRPPIAPAYGSSIDGSSSGSSSSGSSDSGSCTKVDYSSRIDGPHDSNNDTTFYPAARLSQHSMMGGQMGVSGAAEDGQSLLQKPLEQIDTKFDASEATLSHHPSSSASIKFPSSLSSSSSSSQYYRQPAQAATYYSHQAVTNEGKNRDWTTLSSSLANNNLATSQSSYHHSNNDSCQQYDCTFQFNTNQVNGERFQKSQINSLACGQGVKVGAAMALSHDEHTTGENASFIHYPQHSIQQSQTVDGLDYILQQNLNLSRPIESQHQAAYQRTSFSQRQVQFPINYKYC